ncbi:MAG: GGDEF domain-containing protein [Candidatus Manganitrophaceae bacterium]|nr:MAG: GGDEF domain-containing protein [Candidatus Manganitrophaceae bacterium]
MHLLEEIGRQSKGRLIFIGLSLVLFLGIADFLTGPDLSFLIFYLIPVFLVTWFVGGRAGALMSLISATVWFSEDVLSRSSYSHPLIPYWNAAVKLGFFLILTDFLSRLKAGLEREKALARSDELTGAANRRAFLESAAIELYRSRRYRHPLTFAYLDVDNFKQVNDRLGHSAGDALLRAMTQTVHDHLRAIDLFARLGGDEFGLLLPETGYGPAEIVLRKIQESLLIAMEKNGWPVTFSIGAVTWTAAPAAIDEMIQVADGLMYSVKNGGKNQIRHEQLEEPPR